MSMNKELNSRLFWQREEQQSHFIQCFKKQTGLSPKEYRENYARSQGFY